MSRKSSTASTNLADPSPERSASTSFTTVTELPGSKASREQRSMAMTRYRLAADLGAGKEVLEVACGSGMGLGYLARRASRVVGGDFDPSLVKVAQAQYGERLPVQQMDAQQLPFPDNSFDLVMLLEAIYYLPEAEAFVREARRVLRAGGTLYLCSANREWPEFNPSPFSVRYYSLKELGELLSRAGFVPELLTGFPTSQGGWKSKVIGLVRQIAVRLHLIPDTMEGKEALKRLFYGKLEPLPSEMTDDIGEFHPPVPYSSPEPVTGWKVLYAIGRLPDAAGSHGV